mmetsp:Transcript_6716/g.12922  ORF Transcript_6716/g.12922 Transcript_6716/m.12922 type:complete len:267 (-) Transcript_6716:658-1458(-)
MTLSVTTAHVRFSSIIRCTFQSIARRTSKPKHTLALTTLSITNTHITALHGFKHMGQIIHLRRTSKPRRTSRTNTLGAISACPAFRTLASEHQVVALAVSRTRQNPWTLLDHRKHKSAITTLPSLIVPIRGIIAGFAAAIAVTGVANAPVRALLVFFCPSLLLSDCERDGVHQAAIRERFLPWHHEGNISKIVQKFHCPGSAQVRASLAWIRWHVNFHFSHSHQILKKVLHINCFGIEGNLVGCFSPKCQGEVARLRSAIYFLDFI